MYVWDQIYKNRNLWTEAELNDALKYINEWRLKADLPLIKLQK